MSISVFTHSSKRDKNGDYSVYLRVTHKGKRFLVATGISTTGLLQGTTFPKSDKNAKVKKFRLDTILAMAESIEMTNPSASLSQLKQLITNELYPHKAKDKLTLMESVYAFSKLKNGRTIKLYELTAKKVAEYDMDANLDDITPKWLSGFQQMCAKTMKQNSVAIHLRNIRAVINWAIEEGLTQNYPFKQFKVKYEKTRKRNLTIEQLRTLRDYPCEEFQKQYRDLFMLMFYLIGINTKDLLNLRHKDLVNGRIEYTRAKTGKHYSVKVEPEAMEIIKRYKGKNYLLTPLDRYKDHMNWLHHCNDTLKTIGKTYKIGVKTSGNALFPDLSTYWSRHTWSTIAAELDTPIDVIAHALGHEIPGLDVTSIYIHFNEKKVDDANRKVIDLVNSQ